MTHEQRVAVLRARLASVNRVGAPALHGVSAEGNSDGGVAPVTPEERAAEPQGTPGLLLGVSPKFAARLSAEDLEDIKAGDIPVKTVQAFEAAAVARESEDLSGTGTTGCGIAVLGYVPGPEDGTARNKRNDWNLPDRFFLS